MILVECNPDEVLVRLLIGSRNIEHCGSKSGICKRLSRKYRDSIGLVDHDPGSAQPRYIRELLAQGKSKRIDDITIIYDPRRNNYIIMLYPRLEEWIIKVSKQSGIKLSKYNLPSDGNKLHREINARLYNFEKFLEELIKKSRELNLLREILKRPYNFIL